MLVANISLQVFTSPIWEILGLKQPPVYLRRETSRLGVKEDPSVHAIIVCLNKPECRPSDIDSAAVLFEYLYVHGSMSVSRVACLI